MNTPRHGHGVLWFLRSIVIVALTMVLATMALVGHSLTTIRNERFRLAHSASPFDETEQKLAVAWERFLIAGAAGLALILWLALLSARRIDRQVKAVEAAKAETERERETTQTLMCGQQAAGRRLERAVHELQQSEQRFRTLSASAPIGIFETDPAGLCTYTNPEWQKIAGRPLDQCLGESWRNAIHPEDAADMFAAWHGAVAAGAEFDREIRFCRPDGETRWTHLRSVAVRAESGAVTGHVGTVEDITMRKEIEAEICYVHDAALESTRLKSRFLANMSHEIRTPMNGVIGMANLLLDTSLTGDQRDFAETIRTSAEGLLTVINDILDFSKIEAGKITFEETDFDLQDVFESTLELLAETAQRKHIEFAGFIDPGVPTLLRGDAGRIRQVLTNLLGNAVKFTQQGEVTAQVSLVAEGDSHAELRFRVRDTGVGIGTEGQRRLFAAFSQADVSTTRQFGGTGLGLAISRQLVEKMGGQIGVKSVEGRGSTFWFTLPLARQPQPLPALVGDHTLAGSRVLIVDDNTTSGGFLHEQIDAWRMRNDVVRNGIEALAKLREAARGGDAYTLALIDLDMPEMDGLALAREIHADRQIAGTRLVLLTAYGRRIPSQDLARAGIAECRSKPVRQSTLFDCLAGVMASSTTAPSVVSSSSPTPAPRRKERILIAEDNPVNQKVALGQLRKLGYRAEAVGNGFEALQALGQIAYDIVLMDCHMPEMDGYEATAAIRQHEGQARHTWIIAMTANAIQGDREQCLAAGMDDYVSKPVRLNELGEALERAHRRIAPAQDRRVIDPDRIAELRALSGIAEGDVLADLTQIFVAQAPQLVAEIFDAHARSDIGGLTAAAHFLKGSSGQFGASHLHHVCAEIEKAGRRQSLHQMPDLLESVACEVQHVIAALTEELHPPEPKYA